MENRPVPVPVPVPYLRGRLRDRNAVSRCKHLNPGLLVNIQLVQTEETGPLVQLPSGSEPRKAVRRVITSRPSLGFFCTSPDVYRAMTEELADDIKPQIPLNGLMVSTDFCAMCPFWDGAKMGAKKDEQ